MISMSSYKSVTNGCATSAACCQCVPAWFCSSSQAARIRRCQRRCSLRQTPWSRAVHTLPIPRCSRRHARLFLGARVSCSPERSSSLGCPCAAVRWRLTAPATSPARPAIALKPVPGRRRSIAQPASFRPDLSTRTTILPTPRTPRHLILENATSNETTGERDSAATPKLRRQVAPVCRKSSGASSGSSSVAPLRRWAPARHRACCAISISQPI